MSLGYTRKELGKLHRQCYEQCLERTHDEEAFQRSMLSMVKAMLDVIDANNRKMEEDIKIMLGKTPKG